MRSSLLAGLLVPIALLAGCVSEEPPRPREAEPPGGASAAADEQTIVAAGEAAALALTRELMSRVAAAISEGGPAHAIDFCSEEALPLTSAKADELGVAIKRTSSRVRNPRNAPDADEQAALAYFEGELEAGRALPEHLVRQSDGEIRYYRPIVVAELCTACHGSRETLEPAVRDALDRRYPDDRATGYRVGDFRGLVRVSVPSAASH